MTKPNQEDRLEQIEDKIQAARRQAEADGLLPGEKRPTFIDPDADGDADEYIPATP